MIVIISLAIISLAQIVFPKFGVFMYAWVYSWFCTEPLHTSGFTRKKIEIADKMIRTYILSISFILGLISLEIIVISILRG